MGVQVPLRARCEIPGCRSDDGLGFLVLWGPSGSGCRLKVADVSVGRCCCSPGLLKVADVSVGRCCLGELSATFVDIGDMFRDIGNLGWGGPCGTPLTVRQVGEVGDRGRMAQISTTTTQSAVRPRVGTLLDSAGRDPETAHRK